MFTTSRLFGLGTVLVILAAVFFGWFFVNNGQIGLAQAGKTITVCASGCDFTRIQAAIDAAPNGGTIQVQAGTYKENLTITGKQGLTLQGAGMNAVTLDGSAGVAVQSPAISIQHSQNVTIQGLKIINSRRGLHAIGTAGLVVTNNSFQNNLRQAVLLEQQTEIQMTNNLFQNTHSDKDGKQGDGVYMLDTKAVLKGNTISGNANYGVVAAGASAQSGSTVTIEQNTISGNSYLGIGLYGTSTATIDGNTIAGNVEEGIYLGNTAHAQIANNQITSNKATADCCGFGINLAQNAQATIQGNTISQNQTRGIAVQDNAQATFQMNTITGNGSTGLRVRHNARATINNNTISGNVANGVDVFENAQVTITNNQIKNNVIGVQVGDPSLTNETAQAEISKNTIRNNSSCGVFADSDSGIKVTGQGNDVGTLCGDKSKFPAGFGGGK
jgi:parallel beta-helix repeat protein